VRKVDSTLGHTEEVQAQIVRDLYERSRSSTIILLVVVLMFCWAMGAAYKTDGQIRGLFWLLVVVSLIRWILVMIPAVQRDAWVSVKTQYRIFAAGVVLTSSTLALLTVRAWPILETAHLAILAAVISGIVSGALMSLGSSLVVYMLYALPTVGAIVVMAATDSRPRWGADLLATSFLLYGATVVAISIDHSRVRRRGIELSLELSNLVLRDSLTELRNRRFLQEYMTVEQARLAPDAADIERFQKAQPDAAIAVYMMDLDHFKVVNDTHGHTAGDLVLRQLAEVLTASIRKSDVLVRWGGEEFVLVARIKLREDARIVAENLRHRIETTDFRLPKGSTLRLTCSLGFCVLPFFPDQPRKLNWEQALGLADAALYIAKQEGRNRWVGAGRGTTPWDDTSTTFLEIRDDLKRASERGQVVLERGS
jgi:diguanylate cyclase (GGDEF)-like protein